MFESTKTRKMLLLYSFHISSRTCSRSFSNSSSVIPFAWASVLIESKNSRKATTLEHDLETVFNSV